MLLVVTDDGKLLLHHRDDKPGIAHPGPELDVSLLTLNNRTTTLGT